MNYLHQRSGILTADNERVYRFPHRSFQEYLAACHLVRTGFPEKLASDVKNNPPLWREVLLLAVGKVAETPFMAWALLEDLVREEPGDRQEVQEPELVQALYAGLAIEENELWRDPEARDALKLERIRQWLERSLEVGALPPVDRAAAGRVLGLLGDRRSGVGVTEGGVPELDWVEVPAGTFRMASSDEDQKAYDDEKPQHDVELASFQISRHPVTNAQYRAFVDDGGYADSWRKCWSDAGWEWKSDRQGPDDNLSPEYLLPNHPRVSVSWFEAAAFSRWLGQKLNASIRLPTEAEWEKAARGTDGRIYPWGNEFDAALCNVRETGIDQPSPVGMFPQGASPYGVLDMSGNAREWTLSPWTDDYKEQARGTKAPPKATDIASASALRVFRGGSCWGTAGLARCAYRGPLEPQFANRSLGFRVLLPSPRASRVDLRS